MIAEDQLKKAELILKSIINSADEEVINGSVRIPLSCIADINSYFDNEKSNKENID